MNEDNVKLLLRRIFRVILGACGALAVIGSIDGIIAAFNGASIMSPMTTRLDVDFLSLLVTFCWMIGLLFKFVYWLSIPTKSDMETGNFYRRY